MKAKLCRLFVLPLLLLASCGKSTNPTSEASSSQKTSIEDSTSSSAKVWTEVKKDGDVTVDSLPEEIVIGANNDYQVKLAFNPRITNSKAELSVSDPSVLPLDALSYHAEGDGSFHDSAYVSIDAEKIDKEGEAYLEMDISSPNSAGAGGTVCFKLTGVSAPDGTYWNETVLFEGPSAFQKIKLEEGERLYAYFTDNDHVNGFENPNRSEEEVKTYGWFERDLSALLEGEEQVSVPFQYAVHHDITLRVYVKDESGKASAWYEINDTVGQGSSATGFDEYDKETARLTFQKEHSSLKLTISDKTYQ